MEDLKDSYRKTSKRCKDPGITVVNRSAAVEAIALFIMDNSLDLSIPDEVTLTQFVVEYIREPNVNRSDVLIKSPSSSKVLKIECLSDFLRFYFDNQDRFEELESRGQSLVRSGVRSKREPRGNVRESRIATGTLYDNEYNPSTFEYAETSTRCGTKILMDPERLEFLKKYSFSVATGIPTIFLDGRRTSVSEIIREELGASRLEFLNENPNDFRSSNLKVIT